MSGYAENEQREIRMRQTDIWHIKLLGEFGLWFGDVAVKPFQHSKAASLLAYIVYHNERGHDRKHLAALIWQDLNGDRAYASIRSALLRIRQRIEQDDFVVADRNRVHILSEKIKCDAHDFRLMIKKSKNQNIDRNKKIDYLNQAVEQYKGQLLPGFEEPWIVIERQKLQDDYIDALNQLARFSGSEKNWTEAINYTCRALDEDMYREENHRSLIQLYKSAGRPAAAKKHFDEFERVFREELNTLPSAETRNLIPRARPKSPAEVGDPQRPSTPVANVEIPKVSSYFPLALSQFFGRVEERSDLIALLSEGSRLITLVGTGGVGKTRLAQEAAHHWDSSKSFVCWVALAEVGKESRLMDVVLSALRRTGMPPAPQPATSHADASEEEVVVLLRKHKSLLVLDNMEHLDSRSLQQLIQTLLQRIPNLTILCTSRSRLGITGEQLFSMLPLPIPRRGASLQETLSSPSVCLLQDRVRLLRPDFIIDVSILSTIQALCLRLEGIPLAIEMAAARFGIMTPITVLERIESSYKLLKSANIDVPIRHMSLYATIQWSIDLLSPNIQEFLIKMSVFRGGWTLEASEIVGDTDLAGDYLQVLFDNSLIYCEEITINDDMPRFRYFLLESVRVFLDEKLADRDRSLCHRLMEAYYRRELFDFEYGKNTSGRNINEFLETENKNISKILSLLSAGNSNIRDSISFLSKIMDYYSAVNRCHEGIKWGGLFVDKYIELYDVDKGVVDDELLIVIRGMAIIYSICLDDGLYRWVINAVDKIGSWSGSSQYVRRFNFILASLEFGRGNMEKSREYFLQIHRDGEKSEIVLLNIVSTYIRDRDYPSALALLDSNQEICGFREIAVRLSLKSYVFCGIGHYDKALICVREAENRFSKLYNQRGEHYCRLIKARIYFENNNLSDSVENILDCWEYFVCFPEWGVIIDLMKLTCDLLFFVDDVYTAVKIVYGMQSVINKVNWGVTKAEESEISSRQLFGENRLKEKNKIDKMEIEMKSTQEILDEYDLYIRELEGGILRNQR